MATTQGIKLMTIRDLRIRRARVIVRVDFNEPISGRGHLSDDFRIRAAMPTLMKLLADGNQLVIISHLGRPNGKKRRTMSMKPIARRLSALLKRRVVFIRDPFSVRSRRFLATFEEGRVCMLENIRFWQEEEKNNVQFAEKLSRFGKYYVNDAFGASHRAHASIAGISRLLPSCAGLLLAREVRALDRMCHHQRHPFFVILAGGKASGKIELAKKFIHEADGVLLGGAIANSVLMSRGFEIGRSVAYHEMKNMKKMFNVSSQKLYTPLDVIVSPRIAQGAGSAIKLYSGVAAHDYIVDVGPATRRFFIKMLKNARTILWNGPLGVVEIPEFSAGTLAIINALKRSKAYKVTGGGDTVALLQKHRLVGVFDHVSTGGGAMLEYLAGKKMPGIEALRK